MANETYFSWLTKNTATTWWNDSGDPGELDFAAKEHMSGVTTNPVLSYTAWKDTPDYFRGLMTESIEGLEGDARAAAIMSVVVKEAARRVEPTFRATNGAEGYACAQVAPALAGDREPMLKLAREFNTWAPNIAVKLPVTLAGLDVLEDCVAEGITVTATVSFTVPQVYQVAERHRMGAARARANGIEPGHCFAVIMIGRLDDYLREVAHDCKADISESDIQQAGIAATKNAYRIYQEKGYEAKLLIAALRGTYHMTELAGADLIMSIHPRYQTLLMQPDTPRESRIDVPVDADVLKRLMTLDEFVRSYEPDGMRPEEFIRFGATQKTLSQFQRVGWLMLQSFDIAK